MANRPVHFEIQVDDIERGAKFYREVFGWKIEQWPGMDYWMIITDSSSTPDKLDTENKEPGINGGMLKRPVALKEGVCGSNAFVCTMQVDDYDAMSEKILAAGGKVAMPKFDLAGMAWQGYFLDTEGNTFGLHQVVKKEA